MAEATTHHEAEATTHHEGYYTAKKPRLHTLADLERALLSV